MMVGVLPNSLISQEKGFDRFHQTCFWSVVSFLATVKVLGPLNENQCVFDHFCNSLESLHSILIFICDVFNLFGVKRLVTDIRKKRGTDLEIRI